MLAMVLHSLEDREQHAAHLLLVQTWWPNGPVVFQMALVQADLRRIAQ
jgi:hypothetical protein